MRRLSKETRVLITKMLTEGNSIRATARMAGVSKNTVLKLLVDLGRIASAFQDETLRGLSCKHVEVDEIWSFCGSKQKNTPESKKGEAGDVWTWTAIDADSKLVITWLVGDRDGVSAKAFVADLARRLASRIQLTSDGLGLYVEAVENAFGSDVDFAQMIKEYSGDAVQSDASRRYSPSKVISSETVVRSGNPDPDHVSTSYVERLNLTTRMSVRRFTRLTNAFSKKIENHAHAVALHFFHYNFCRIHRSLRVTPAMEAGVTDRVWDVGDLVQMLIDLEDEEEALKGPRRTRGKK